MRRIKLLKKCNCGCGILVVSKKKNAIYIHGHNRRGKKALEETICKLRAINRGKNNPRYGVRVSKETCFKMSLSHKGVKHTKETIEKMKGRIPWNKGLKNCFSKEALRKIGDNGRGRKDSKETKIKRSITKIGSKNPQWLGGKSFILYGKEFIEELKAQIRKRDNHRCRICGKKRNRKKHQVHHIDYNKQHNGLLNLITLRVNCHAMTNSNRDYWKNILAEKMVA